MIRIREMLKEIGLLVLGLALFPVGLYIATVGAELDNDTTRTGGAFIAGFGIILIVVWKSIFFKKYLSK